MGLKKTMKGFMEDRVGSGWLGKAFFAGQSVFLKAVILSVRKKIKHPHLKIHTQTNVLQYHMPLESITWYLDTEMGH